MIKRGEQNVLPLGTNMNDLLGAKFGAAGLKDSREETKTAPFEPAVHTVAAEKNPKVAEFRPRSETPLVKSIKIAIKTKGKILLIHPGDILAVEAEGNYVLLRRLGFLLVAGIDFDHG